MLDLSSGQFHDDFSRSADDFVKAAEDSKALTTGTVNAVALDTVEGDRALVLTTRSEPTFGESRGVVRHAAGSGAFAFAPVTGFKLATAVGLACLAECDAGAVHDARR